MNLPLYIVQTFDLHVKLPYIEKEAHRRGPHVGRFGEMPVPDGKRRKLKKWKRRK